MNDLTDDQVADLRRDLTVLRDEIDRLLDMTKDGSRPVDLDEPIGRLSRMDALQQQSLIRANRRGLDARRRQVAAALSGLDKGEYGLCRFCEEPIAFRRLKVRPEAPFCISCQEEMESKK